MQDVTIQNEVRQTKAIDYSVSDATTADDILSFFKGTAMGFAVLYVFYKIIPLAVVVGTIVGFVNIFFARQNMVKKRLDALRTQFFDLLEAMSVSMRAGNPPYRALMSARDDLLLIYPDSSDIIVEVNLMLKKFNNSVPLSQAFDDFAKRSGLEDIQSFASVYATIEGKSSRADEIIRDTQDIITDKMAIEMEIDTIMTSAKSEANIMLFMPLVLLILMGAIGDGFMNAIYTTPTGRVVATFGLIMFFISFGLVRKFSNIKL